MIPILYKQSETAFADNGICRLVDCVSCEVTEERNGVYELEFVYPITGRGYDQIKEGLIVTATHDNTGEIEPFDIYARSAPIDGLVTFYASHISYRLSNYILKPFSANGIVATMARIREASLSYCPFTFWIIYYAWFSITWSFCQTYVSWNDCVEYVFLVLEVFF